MKEGHPFFLFDVHAFLYFHKKKNAVMKGIKKNTMQFHLLLEEQEEQEEKKAVIILFMW
jgi:hypothetical protein